MSKRLQGFSCFRVIYQKLSGMFFQRAEGKLEADSPFNQRSIQETRNERFTWKQRKTQILSVPFSPCNSENLNVTICL